jgi:hypothetical protein
LFGRIFWQLFSVTVEQCGMPAVDVQHYLRRAADFSSGMKLLSSDPAYWNSAALLAIHSAISYSDALRIGLGENRLSADDHSKAADLLDERLPLWLEDRKGLKHFRKLLSKKSRVEYSRRRLGLTDANDLVTDAIRFEIWVNRIGKQLNLEGWTRDDQ